MTQTKNRTVVRVLATLPMMGGLLRRVIGSTDIHGAGTPWEVPELGPFVMFDEARGLEGPEMPPFGMHPHAGLVAVSIIPEGGRWTSRSNVPKSEPIPLDSGDVLLSHAGWGVVHDEHTTSAGSHSMMQIILRLPAAARESRPWFRKLGRVSLEADGVHCALGPGELRELGLDSAIHLGRMSPSSTAAVDIPSTHSEILVYVREGSASVCGTEVRADHFALLADEGAMTLESGGEGAYVVVLSGSKVDEPWVRLLGHNGFLIGGDAEAAQAKMAEFTGNPEGFGVSGEI